MTARFGTGSGDTATIAANAATYLGTFRASADGQTEFKIGGMAAGGGIASLLVWNAYNRVPISPQVQDSTANWADTGDGAYHPFNAGGTGSGLNNRIQYVRGLNEDTINAWMTSNVGSAGGQTCQMAIGVDSTTSASGFKSYKEGSAIENIYARNCGLLGGLGFHYLQALAYSSGSTITWYGNGNSALWAETRY